MWDRAVAYWKTLHSDPGAHFDRVVRLDAAKLPPIVSWGTSPQDVASVLGTVPRARGCHERRQAGLARTGACTTWA